MKRNNTIFRVPNNEEGKLFLALARKYLNKNDYDLRQRGRTPNDKKLKKDKLRKGYYRQHLPLKYSDNLGIYLIGKYRINGRLVKETVGISSIEQRIDSGKRWSEAYSSGFQQGKRYLATSIRTVIKEEEV